MKDKIAQHNRIYYNWVYLNALNGDEQALRDFRMNRIGHSLLGVISIVLVSIALGIVFSLIIKTDEGVIDNVIRVSGLCFWWLGFPLIVGEILSYIYIVIADKEIYVGIIAIVVFVAVYQICNKDIWATIFLVPITISLLGSIMNKIYLADTIGKLCNALYRDGISVEIKGYRIEVIESELDPCNILFEISAEHNYPSYFPLKKIDDNIQTIRKSTNGREDSYDLNQTVFQNLAAYNKKIAEMYAGVINPYSNKGIFSVQEYVEYVLSIFYDEEYSFDRVLSFEQLNHVIKKVYGSKKQTNGYSVETIQDLIQMLEIKRRQRRLKNSSFDDEMYPLKQIWDDGIISEDEFAE